MRRVILSHKKKKIKNLIRQRKINLFALLETRVKAQKFCKISQHCFGSWRFANNYNEAVNGRIWLAWDQTIWSVQVQSANVQFLHVMLQHLQEGWSICLIVVYASNDKTERSIAWSLLEQLGASISIPQILTGDFNKIVSNNEKISLAGVSEFHSSGLADFLAIRGLMDLPYQGFLFTWSNQQIGQDHVSCKLDCVLGNEGWFDEHECAMVNFTKDQWQRRPPFR